MSANLEALRNALADRYEIQRELGTGGMATVYLAHDVRHQRQVAVKVLRPDLATVLGPDRFLREIRIAANLTHPHILPLHDSGEARVPRLRDTERGTGGEAFLYYVMPYIEGETLRERVTAEGELPVADAIRILREVVDALAFAHGKGVVHRDIKPDNVMLSGGHAIVADFGVAKAVSDATGRDQLTTAGIALGTPAYMAPEQASADPHVDHRADIYAVGAMAYELLAGRPPFTGATPQSVLAAHISQEAEPLSKYRSKVPAALEGVVMRCLQKKPADRWQSAAEIVPQLDALATPSGGVTPTETKPFQAVRSGRRWAAAVGAIAVAAIAIVSVVLRGDREPASSGLDPDRLAIAPFDVLGTDVDTSWAEGLALLVRNALDGAGGIRTSDANQTIRRWNGLDTPTPEALGRSLGTGLVVTGTLVGAGRDSVRIAATVHDVEADATVGSSIELRLVSGRIDNVADSIAVRLLGVLSETRPDVGAFQLRSIGSTSPAAIRAFLRGEQFYRTGTMDSALVSYEEAVQADSTFALAYARIAMVNNWGAGDRNLAIRSGLLAGRFNHGLAPRESLLVLTDSLQAVLGPSSMFEGAPYRHPDIVSRLGQTLQEASRRYPGDPQVWYRLGEHRYHIAWSLTPAEDIVEAFTRAVELDSLFVPPYIHLLDLPGTRQEMADRARGIVRGRLAGTLAGFDRVSEPILEILATERPDALDWQALASRLDEREKTTLARYLVRTTDAAETALEAVRILPDGNTKAIHLAYLGHATEAFATVRGDTRPLLAIELGLLGALDPDTVEAALAPLIGDPLSIAANPWWSARGDTSSITAALAYEVRWMDSSFATGGLPWEVLEAAAQAWGMIPPDAQLARTDSSAAMELVREKSGERFLMFGRAHLLLARGDSVGALRLFRGLYDAGFDGCRGGPLCQYNRLAVASLLSASGDDPEAVRLLDTPMRPPNNGLQWPTEVAWVFERGRVNERLGNREAAAAAYAFVVNAWGTADSTLQERYVQPAREGLARLGGER